MLPVIVAAANRQRAFIPNDLRAQHQAGRHQRLLHLGGVDYRAVPNVGDIAFE
jgi:hypothetical protein